MKVTHRSLLILLTSSLLTFSVFGTLMQAAENSPHQVNGVLNGSAYIPIKLSSATVVEKIEWDFFHPTRGKPCLLGVSRGGKLELSDISSRSKQLEEKTAENLLRMRANLSNRTEHDNESIFCGDFNGTHLFRDRLAMVNRTMLNISFLETEDAGIYRARVWFNAEHFKEHKFNLAVYEPVPAPWILYRVFSNTREGCNVTLWCQVPRQGKYHISWERGNLSRASIGDSSKYRLLSNSRNLCASWRKSSPDSTFTCLASNPADQNEASIDLLNICTSVE